MVLLSTFNLSRNPVLPHQTTTDTRSRITWRLHLRSQYLSTPAIRWRHRNLCSRRLPHQLKCNSTRSLFPSLRRSLPRPSHLLYPRRLSPATTRCRHQRMLLHRVRASTVPTPCPTRHNSYTSCNTPLYHNSFPTSPPRLQPSRKDIKHIQPRRPQ